MAVAWSFLPKQAQYFGWSTVCLLCDRALIVGLCAFSDFDVVVIFPGRCKEALMFWWSHEIGAISLRCADFVAAAVHWTGWSLVCSDFVDRELWTFRSEHCSVRSDARSP